MRLHFRVAIATFLVVAATTSAATEQQDPSEKTRDPVPHSSSFTNFLSNLISSPSDSEADELEEAPYAGPELKLPPPLRGSQHHRMLPTGGCTGANKKLPRCKNKGDAGNDSPPSSEEESASDSFDRDDKELNGESWGGYGDEERNKKKVKRERDWTKKEMAEEEAENMKVEDKKNTKKKKKEDKDDADDYDSIDYWDLDDMEDPVSYFKKAEKLEKKYQKKMKAFSAKHPAERTDEEREELLGMINTLDGRFKHAPGLNMDEKKKLVKLQKEIRKLEQNDPEQVAKLQKELKKLKAKKKLSSAEEKKVAEFEQRIKDNTKGDPDKIKALKREMKSTEKKALKRLRETLRKKGKDDYRNHQQYRADRGIDNDSVEIKKWEKKFNKMGGDSIKSHMRAHGVKEEDVDIISYGITHIMSKYAIKQSHNPYGGISKAALARKIKKKMKEHNIKEDKAEYMSEKLAKSYAGAVYTAFRDTYGMDKKPLPKPEPLKQFDGSKVDHDFLH